MGAFSGEKDDRAGDLTGMTVHGLAAALAAGRATSVDIVEAHLARIAAEGLVFCGGHMRLPGQEEDPMGAAFLRLAAKGEGWTARVG